MQPTKLNHSHGNLAEATTPQRHVGHDRAPSQQIANISVLIAAGIFIAVLLVINHRLFSVPIREYTDFAANALQIERAKHFHELLGNYSRWNFHHPGPAIFYILAFGEALLRDLLHIVPAEMNSQILTMIVVNTAFLFGTIAFLARRSASTLFVPVALALSIFFIYVLNRSIPGSAVMSIWMPHVLLFPFLFFVTSCAVVAAGEVSQLPWLAFSGLLLLHAHAAQPLFVGTLSVLVAITLWFNNIRMMGLRRFTRAYRTPLIISAALCILFAFPIVLEALVHKPSNIHALSVYTSLYPGLQQSLGMSLKYEASFLAFVPDPEVVLQSKSAHLIALGGAKPSVVVYWCLSWLLIGMVVGTYAGKKKSIPPFFLYLIAGIIVVSLLFLVWTLKMGGQLFSFNGYFIYGMQLLTLLVLAALILDGLELSARPALVFALCVLVPISMFSAKKGFQNALTDDGETDRLYAAIPANVGPVHLGFTWDEWLQVLGVAYRLKHDNRPFCIGNPWVFSFDADNVCREIDGDMNLVLTGTPGECKVPCQILYKDNLYELQLFPYPYLKLPFAVDPKDNLTLNIDFCCDSADSIWSAHRSAVRFRLDPDVGDASKIRITVLGTALPGRPAAISVNGHPIGRIVAGSESNEFLIDRSILRPGAENEVGIEVDNAGPVGQDPRTFGFLWKGLQFAAVR